jgi:hypothetical protein
MPPAPSGAPISYGPSQVPENPLETKTGEKGAEFREYVLCVLDELGALADETVTATRQRAVDRAGNRKHLASLLGREPRGDERSARQRCLDDERPHREPADDAIAAREVLGERWHAGRKLGDERAVRGDLARERCVFAGIDAIGATALHRDRAASASERTAMARGVDAEREPAGDGEPCAREMLGELRGRVAADRGRVARADHRELRQAEYARVALDEEHERGVLDRGEKQRILRRAVAREAAATTGEPALVVGEPDRLRIPERVDCRRGEPERRQRIARLAHEPRRVLAQRSGRQLARVQAGDAREHEPRIRVVHVRRAYRDSHPAGSSRIDALGLASGGQPP